MFNLDISVLDLQKAQDQIQKELEKQFGNSYVTIGLHEEQGGAAVHDAESGMTNAAIGAANHFGVPGHIPARPWLDVGVATGNPRYLKILEQCVEKDEPVQVALGRIGVEAVGFTQVYMTNLRTPPNAAYTIAKKGSDNPLIDTGLLRQSVTFKIETDEPSEGI